MNQCGANTAANDEERDIAEQRVRWELERIRNAAERVQKSYWKTPEQRAERERRMKQLDEEHIRRAQFSRCSGLPRRHRRKPLKLGRREPMPDIRAAIAGQHEAAQKLFDIKCRAITEMTAKSA